MIVAEQLKFAYDPPNNLQQYVYNFAVPFYSKVGVFGANGSGKSTLFLLMAGLLKPDDGNLIIGTEVITHLCAHKRQMSVMFQNYNLFEHLTVEKNLELALANNKTSSKKDVYEYLDKFGLYDLRHKKSVELSGGEKQKAGLVRCLISHKPILLLDEPFSAMDPSWRDKAMQFLLAETTQYAQTMFIIGHNPLEMCNYLSHVIFIHKQQIYYTGTASGFIRSTDPVIREYLQIQQQVTNADTTASHIIL